MKTSREMEIASSRKRMPDESRSSSPSVENNDESVSDYELSYGLSKSRAKAPNKRQKSNHAVITNQCATCQKVPPAFKTDGGTLLDAKWWKEVGCRDAFWKELKKRIPKSELKKRLTVGIIDDLNEEVKVADVNGNVAAAGSKSKTVRDKGKGSEAIVATVLRGQAASKALQKKRSDLDPATHKSNKTYDQGVEEYIIDNDNYNEDQPQTSESTQQKADELLETMIKTRPDMATIVEDEKKTKAAIANQLEIEKSIAAMNRTTADEKKTTKKTSEEAENQEELSIEMATNEAEVAGEAKGLSNLTADTGNGNSVVVLVGPSEETSVNAAEADDVTGGKGKAPSIDVEPVLEPESKGNSKIPWEPKRF